MSRVDSRLRFVGLEQSSANATGLRLAVDGAVAIPLAYSPSWAFPWTDVSGAGADSATTRVRRTARFGQTSLQPCFSGANQNANLPNAYTIAACYIERSGSLYQVLFGGSASIVVNPGDWVAADVVAGLTLTAGATYYVRTHITITSTSLDLPWGQIANSQGAIGEATNRGASAPNLANATGTTGLSTTTGYFFGPVTVKAVPTATAPPLVAGLGDSITAGTGNEGGWTDDDGVLIYQVGFGDQAASKAGASFICLGRYGEIIPVSPFTANNMVFREARVAPAKTVVVLYGTNNVRGGSTFSDTMTDWAAYVAHVLATFPNARIIVCTLVTETTSSDGWTTPGGQTPVATESVRTAVNDAIRGHALLASEDRLTLIDTVDGVEVNSAGVPTRNGGRIDTAGGAPTSDGLHPDAIGGELMADQMMRQGYASLIRHGTAATAAPLAVTGLQATAGISQVALAWNTPDVQGKALTTYSVRYREVGAGSWTTFSYADIRCRPEATITGLTGGLTYEFEVAGVNSKGTGAYSSAVTATPTVPANPDFYDNFTDPDGTLLTAHTSDSAHTWHKDASGQVGDKDGVITANKLRGQANYARVLSNWTPASAEHDLTATIVRLSNTGNGQDLVVAADEGDGSGYVLAYDPASDTLTLYQDLANSYTSLGSHTMGWSVGTSHTVTIARRSSGITVTEAASAVITSADATITAAGRVGFQLAGGDGATGVAFDYLEAVNA